MPWLWNRKSYTRDSILKQSGRRVLSSERSILFGYFLLHILAGTILLSMDFCWAGNGDFTFLDSLFTSVSAVCVTGLSTVNTSGFSMAGQIILLYLIQAGGLGIITFSMLYLFIPGSRMSMENQKIIQGYYSRDSGMSSRKIVGYILLFTFIIEGSGCLGLFFELKKAGDPEPFWNGLFHAVSAFCNAGFSRYDHSLAGYRSNVIVNIIVMLLIISGGLGFMTIWDVVRKLGDWRKRLQLQTKIMLLATPLLIVAGWLLFLVFESSNSLKSLSASEKILASLFQSVTTRTAGFNTIDQASLSSPSYLLTLVLMIIGGGSGSTAGGLKVSTAVLLFLVFIQRMNRKGESRLFNRRIDRTSLTRASMLFVKAMGILILVVFLLMITESGNENLTTGKLAFEAFSALGTVGLSQGITSDLSVLGKLIIILTMFSGRVGLFALVMPDHDRMEERFIDYPKGEVLIG